MNIRPYKENDLEELEKLYLNSRQNSFYWMDQGNFYLDDFIADTEGEKIYVAEENNKILGFISIYEEENFIHNLFVDKRFKHLGVGRKLLDFTKTLYFPLKLKCYTKNFLAASFYDKYGFKAISKDTDPFGESYYLMELK